MRNLPISTNLLARLTIRKLLLSLRTFYSDIKPKILSCYRIIINSRKPSQLRLTARYHIGNCHLHRPDLSWDRHGRGTIAADRVESVGWEG